jgi:phosphopantothenoylcysteine decarboxylase / phosphopantothenate---cysteine ligase
MYVLTSPKYSFHLIPVSLTFRPVQKNKITRVLVTAGPTRAYLDRVRYISNYSTGQQGFEICARLRKLGFEVVTVTGPTHQPWERLRLKKLIQIETNEEMLKATLSLCRSFRPHVAIFSAAVLDFAPPCTAPGKVSSARKTWNIRLVPTPKIIDVVGRKFPSTRRIGFKLEWIRPDAEEMERMALSYLEKKKLEALCVNYLSEIRAKRHPISIYTRRGLLKMTKDKRGTAIDLCGLIQEWNYSSR